MRMRECLAGAAVGALLLAGAPSPSAAQEPSGLLEVGTAAPDFALPGATRFGLLEEPVRLSDFKGKTVVLAFFYRARTRG